MSKGKRLRDQHKSEMMQDYMRTMQQREAIRQAFRKTPIAQAVGAICQSYGESRGN